jgi:hypothetical protein
MLNFVKLDFQEFILRGIGTMMLAYVMLLSHDNLLKSFVAVCAVMFFYECCKLLEFLLIGLKKNFIIPVYNLLAPFTGRQLWTTADQPKTKSIADQPKAESVAKKT